MTLATPRAGSLGCLFGLLLSIGTSLLAGCTPELNWREVRPADADVVLMLPCRPSTFSRRVQVAGQAVQWNLLSCQSAGVTWAIGHARVADATMAAAVLRALQPMNHAQVGVLAGVRPTEGADRRLGGQRWLGTSVLSDGRVVQVATALFTQGVRAYQVTAVGTRLDSEELDFFMHSLRSVL